MNELIADIKISVELELIRTYKKHSMFHSTHEGYAILKEEIEESKDELEYIISQFDVMWVKIKSNYCKQDLERTADLIKKHAILLAAESCQVAAMSQKFINSKLEGEY